jgi:hypothetical protein
VDDSTGAEGVVIAGRVSVPSRVGHLRGVLLTRDSSILDGVMLYDDKDGLMVSNKGSTAYSKLEEVLVGKDMVT